MDDQRAYRNRSTDPRDHISRDPQRIDRMVELLREIWKLEPDWRLNQLIINSIERPDAADSVYYVEDDRMEKNLASMLRVLKVRKESQDKQNPTP